MESSSIPWPQLQFTTLITQVVDEALQRRRQSQVDPANPTNPADPANEADVSIIWNKLKKDQENPYGDSFVQNQK